MPKQRPQRTTAVKARDRAISLIGPRGATPARIAVYATLLAAERPRSHVDIQRELPLLDRVTVYRVLDWLVHEGLAHRVVDATGIWHFAPSVDQARSEHAHFHCDRCGQFYCLTETPAPRLTLPPGFIGKKRGLVIGGTCAGCGH